MNKRWKIIRWTLIILYGVFIIYYTILCRQPGTERIFKPLFWELSRGAWHDIGLNILLFIPLGFLIGKWKGILIGFLLSTWIEIIQFIFKLGFCEMDDVFHNTVGAAVGVLLFIVICRLLEIAKKALHRSQD